MEDSDPHGHLICTCRLRWGECVHTYRSGRGIRYPGHGHFAYSAPGHRHRPHSGGSTNTHHGSYRARYNPRSNHIAGRSSERCNHTARYAGPLGAGASGSPGRDRCGNRSFKDLGPNQGRCCSGHQWRSCGGLCRWELYPRHLIGGRDQPG